MNYDLCECFDPGCPACSGKCHRIMRGHLYRVDMQDKVGTAFCHPCADDAMKSGLFVEEEDNQQEINCHCQDCGMDYSHENKSESGQALLIAIVLVGLGTLAIYIIFAPIFEALFAGLSF